MHFLFRYSRLLIGDRHPPTFSIVRFGILLFLFLVGALLPSGNTYAQEHGQEVEQLSYGTSVISSERHSHHADHKERSVEDVSCALHCFQEQKDTELAALSVVRSCETKDGFVERSSDGTYPSFFSEQVLRLDSPPDRFFDIPPSFLLAGKLVQRRE